MLTLILGGARSGKSHLALRMARASGRPVAFVATMEAGDDETRDRIAAHRAERPASWRTVEAPLDLATALDTSARPGDFAVIDCVTLWISNLLLARLPRGDIDAIPSAEAHDALAYVAHEVEGVLAWSRNFDGDVAIVSNEVGMGIVPAYPLGRLFRDALGAANRTIAARADRTYYLIAGMALDINALGAKPLDAFGDAPE